MEYTIDIPPTFEWDESKNKINFDKHGVTFEEAQIAFHDPRRLIIEDNTHGATEVRYYCVGKINKNVCTVRFTLREGKIRIFGASYWRKEKKKYEKK